MTKNMLLKYMKRTLAVLLVLAMVLIPFGTFTAGIPMRAQENEGNDTEVPDDAYVLQFAIDGLSNARFNHLKALGAETPNLDAIIAEGSRVIDMRTMTPAYVGSYSTAITGASPATNGTSYRYFDKETNMNVADTKVTYSINTPSIFRHLKEVEKVSFLGSGWAMDEAIFQGHDDFYAGHQDFDPKYELRVHRADNKWLKNSIDQTAPDLIEALGRDEIPRYLTLMASDLTRDGWSGLGSDYEERQVALLSHIDEKIGDVMAAAEAAGIADRSYVLVHSLTPTFVNRGKVTTKNLAAAITEDTGVAAQEITGDKTVPKDGVKVVFPKQYVWNYAQMTFTKEATEADKQAVLDYLQDPTLKMGKNIRKIHPIDTVPGVPQGFADYLIEPVPGKSFAAAASTATRNDILSEYDLFAAVKGPGIKPGTSVPGEPTLMDLVPTISKYLGVTTTENVEGEVWTFRNITPPPTLTVQYPKMGQTVFSETLNVLGTVDPATSTVHLNGEPVTVGDDGHFEGPVTLQLGRNELMIEAWNPDGKRSVVESMVNYVVRPDMPEGHHIIYMNWDGFARYQLDEALELGMAPNLKRIMEEGTFFDDLQTSVPSITNSAQAAIVSGTASRHTNNHLRYFDKQLNRAVAVTPRRTNLAETLAESARRQNLDLVSINQFAVEDRGATAGDPLANYVGAGGSDDRFDALIDLIQKKELGGITYEDIPRVILFYVDEIDAYGHNEGKAFRIPTVEGRRQNILEKIQHYDTRLGDVIDAMKAEGVYDKFTFLLTSDHGMARWGRDNDADTSDKGQSRMPDVIRRISALGDGFRAEYVYPDDTTSYKIPDTPSEDADIAITSYGLAVQLSYVNEYDEAVIAEKNAKIEEALKDVEYIGEFWGPEKLRSRGVGRKYADLLIGIVPPYHVHHPSVTDTPARGSHGGIADVEQMIPGFLWGAGIKQGHVVTEHADVIDLVPTLSRLAGILPPLDATGKVHYDALRDIDAPNYTTYFLDAEELALWGDADIVADETASGGYAVADVQGKDSRVAIPSLPASGERLDIHYKAADDVMVRLTVNGHEVREIFLPATTWTPGEYDTKQMNLPLAAGDEVGLEAMASSYDGTLTIDGFTLYSTDETPAYETDADAKPFNLVATPHGDTAGQAGVSWVTHHQGQTNALLVLEGTDEAAADWSQADVYEADSRFLSMMWENEGRRYERHQVILKGLRPDTTYLYRAKNGEALSDVGRFRTDPGQDGSYRMIFMNDPQGKSPEHYEIWSQTVEQLQKQVGTWDLMVLPGDMTDTGLRVPNNAREWYQFFEMAPAATRNSLFVPAIGNHEGRANQGFMTMFPTESALPGALPANSVYSFDYGNVHYAVLNTEMLDSTDQFAPQVAWLEADLEASTADWNIVVLHKGLYSVGSHITDTDITEVLTPMLEPVLDAHAVDVVLQGHDHVFARSLPLKGGEVTDDVPEAREIGGTTYDDVVEDASGTVYLTMNTAGFKFYDLHPDAPLDKFGAYGQPREQMYSVVDVTPERLTFDTYSAVTGERYDSFTLVKSDVAPSHDPMDLDKDGAITILDLSILATFYLSQDMAYDYNDDGRVDAMDMAMLASRIED